MATQPSIVIHGGLITCDIDYDKTIHEQYRETLSNALRSGLMKMKQKGSPLDGVEAAIIEMENCGILNAGRGAVYTSSGTNELDAAVMDGKTGKAGAVAGVNRIKNPILAARTVMDTTWHVLVTGTGAEECAREAGLEMVEPEYFFNQRRWDEYISKKSKQKNQNKKQVHETVGAVAVDEYGNVAAGTSTGGLTMKQWSRVGDSPIIGAGTYANNASCAISCTGAGEYFIRGVVAHDIHARMVYKKIPLQQAIEETLAESITAHQAIGGVIGITPRGEISMQYNCMGMFRGSLRSNGEPKLYFLEERVA